MSISEKVVERRIYLPAVEVRLTRAAILEIAFIIIGPRFRF